MNIRPLCCLLPLIIAGCQDQSSEIASSFVVTVAPNPIQAMKAVKDQLAEGELTEPVRLIGRINAGPDATPWESGKAAFFLADTSDGDTEHDPFGCPYCSRHIEDYQAYISFKDDQQELIGVDARKLFGVAEKQLVVVEGTPSLSSDGFLLMDASKIFIAPDDWKLEEEDKPENDTNSEAAVESDATDNASTEASDPAEVGNSPAAGATTPESP